MFQSSVGAYALILVMPVAFGCALRSAANWQSGLRLLIVVLLFGGIASVIVANGAAAIAFRDLFIVLPMYIGFFSGRDGATALARTPLDLSLAIVTIAGYVLLMVFNPVGAPLLQLLIGLKVWLFYLPFLFVGIALAAQPEVLFRTCRFFLVIGLVPVGIGLLQSLLVRTIGYHAGIELFFGNAAKNATQGFGYYGEAGGIYRIPSTFSFVAQYVEFLYLYLTIAAIELNADPDPRFRRIAEFAVFASIIAGIFSGTRGALLTFPGLLAAYACFGLIGQRILLVAPIALGAGYVVISRAGLSLGSFFSYGWDLTGYYARDFVFQEITSGLADGGLFGAGVGSSTGAARYATSGFVPGISSVYGFESYFAKIATELGSIGLELYAAFLVLIALRAVLPAFAHLFTRRNEIIAPLAIYIAFNLGMSFKGYVLDTDPANIFFWIALGIIVQLSGTALGQIPIRTESDGSHAAAAVPKAVLYRRTRS